MADVALLQFDPETLDLVGVWTSPTAFYYPPDSDPYYLTQGRQAMARQFPDLAWSEWVSYLSASRPARAWWEQAEYDPTDETAEQIFDRVSAEEVESPDEPADDPESAEE